MTHQEAITAIFKQFDSYKSNCLDCDKTCNDDDCEYADNCFDNDLICHAELIEAAKELDE